MRDAISRFALFTVVLFTCSSWGASPNEERKREPSRPASAPHDAVAQFQVGAMATNDKPEAQKNAHDRSDVFDPTKYSPSSVAFKNQPQRGQQLGFDFGRDPLGAMKPLQMLPEIMRKDMDEKPGVMETQRKLLESRYNLVPKFDPEIKMTRGKPICVGPTARLAEGMTWEQFASMTPAQIKERGIFPYLSLPHMKQTIGGMSSR